MFCPFLKEGISCLKSEAEQDSRTNLTRASKNQVRPIYIYYQHICLFIHIVYSFNLTHLFYYPDKET